MSHEPGSPTGAEIASWVVVGLAAVAYVIAFITLGNLPYGSDESAALGWMAFAGAVVGIAAVPAIILTGIRQLIPRLRA